MTEVRSWEFVWFLLSALVGIGGFAYEGIMAYYWGMGWVKITVDGLAEFFVGGLVVYAALDYFVKHREEWIGL